MTSRKQSPPAQPDRSTPEPKRRAWAIWLPLVLFGGFVALVLNGLLAPGEREVMSAMIGKPLPEFDLPPAANGQPGLARADLVTESPRLLNVFASWCVPCAAEAPQLEALARGGVPIDGVAIRDRREDVARFLARYGNPFVRIGKDDVSEVQLGIGSSGVPETFVIDGRGVIRYQHLGPIMDRDVPVLLSELEKARAPL